MHQGCFKPGCRPKSWHVAKFGSWTHQVMRILQNHRVAVFVSVVMQAQELRSLGLVSQRNLSCSTASSFGPTRRGEPVTGAVTIHGGIQRNQGTPNAMGQADGHPVLGHCQRAWQHAWPMFVDRLGLRGVGGSPHPTSIFELIWCEAVYAPYIFEYVTILSCLAQPQLCNYVVSTAREIWGFEGEGFRPRLGHGECSLATETHEVFIDLGLPWCFLLPPKLIPNWYSYWVIDNSLAAGYFQTC